MRGTLNLPLNKRVHFALAGGPYRQRPGHMLGVKMAKEISAECEISIPTADFSIPPKKQMEDGVVEATKLILSGQPLYVGCMGGIGRTGLFLAVMAKAFGVQDPVTYVREHYYAEAVETREQRKYVADFEIPAEAQALIKKAKRSAFFKFWKKGNLTNARYTA